jgi:hypothetical protein
MQLQEVGPASKATRSAWCNPAPVAIELSRPPPILMPHNASRSVADKNRFENAPLCGAFSLYFTISLVAISASLSLNPDLLRAAGVCLHVDLFASVCIDDLERSRRIIQPHRLDLSIDREGVSDG